jgi:hypothetical protein
MLLIVEGAVKVLREKWVMMMIFKIDNLK